MRRKEGFNMSSFKVKRVGRRKERSGRTDMLWDREAWVLLGRCPGRPKGLRLTDSWRDKSSPDKAP